jgi:hypothetical protein
MRSEAMSFYRVKIRVRRVTQPPPAADDRHKFHDLIEKYGGKDVSSGRPSAAYAVGVFRNREKAKAFRRDARAALSAG